MMHQSETAQLNTFKGFLLFQPGKPKMTHLFGHALAHQE
jgi:hypothetical protein